jgi:hypothetical protein
MSAFFSRSPFLLVRPNRAKLLEAVEQLFYFGVIAPAELERVGLLALTHVVVLVRLLLGDIAVLRLTCLSVMVLHFLNKFRYPFPRVARARPRTCRR